MKQNNIFFNELKKQEQIFTKEMVNDTLKYQKQYGFKIGENNSAWNNESDAFRHAYMQAILSKRHSQFVAEKAGNFHERQGNKKGQDPREANMDLWNNRQGRQIAKEISKEYPHFKSLPENLQKDIIAKKVVQKMKAGELITDINDKRQFKNNQNNNPPYTPMRSIGGIQKNGLPTGYATSTDDNNHVFTPNEIDKMSNEEFSKNEKAINAQLNSIGIPTNNELESKTTFNGGIVYVNSYTRNGGTKVKGYYRAG